MLESAESEATRSPSSPDDRLPLASLAGGGALGDSEAFDEVVEDADDAPALSFSSTFDADDDWLAAGR